MKIRKKSKQHWLHIIPYICWPQRLEIRLKTLSSIAEMQLNKAVCVYIGSPIMLYSRSYITHHVTQFKNVCEKLFSSRPRLLTSWQLALTFVKSLTINSTTDSQTGFTDPDTWGVVLTLTQKLKIKIQGVLNIYKNVLDIPCAILSHRMAIVLGYWSRLYRSPQQKQFGNKRN